MVGLLRCDQLRIKFHGEAAIPLDERLPWGVFSGQQCTPQGSARCRQRADSYPSQEMSPIATELFCRMLERHDLLVMDPSAPICKDLLRLAHGFQPFDGAVVLKDWCL